jgi:hypothetical protein
MYTSEEMKTVAGTLVRTFIAACLAQFLSMGAWVTMPLDAWKNVAAAGVAAVAIAAYNWINPKDTRYGKGYVFPGTEEHPDAPNRTAVSVANDMKEEQGGRES